MKAIFFSLIALLLLRRAFAQPHRRSSHQLQHAKKHIVTLVETYIAEEITESQIVIFVDRHGKPVSTATGGLHTKIFKAPAASSRTTSLIESVPNLAAISPSAETTFPTQTSFPATSSNGFGLAYSPYNRDGSCKSAAQALSDFDVFEKYDLVRTYGTDCEQVATVYAACKATIHGDWSAMHTVSIGNELVDSGDASASEVVAAVSAARGLLNSAGYNGSVVTVDTLAATVRPGNSILCDESDYCAVNAHPFFDMATSAEGTGQWLIDNINTLKTSIANPSQKSVVSETGWPSGGFSNGTAVPSPDNQKVALNSIMSIFLSDSPGTTLLSAYNRQWLKDKTGEFGQEYRFGILGDCPSR